MRLLIGILAAATLLSAQTAPYAPKQSDRPEVLTIDEPGFQPIFDGKTLAGWEGNPTYWRAENGVLVGEITPATVIKSNTFIIWRGVRRPPLTEMDYQSTNWKKRINYRAWSSRYSDPRKTVCDEGLSVRHRRARRYDGNNYEEKGRLFLAVRGQMSHVVGGRPPIVLSSFATSDELATVPTSDWNAAHLIVRGNTATHILNGRLMSITVDDDAPNRKLDGLIGMQVTWGRR